MSLYGHFFVSEFYTLDGKSLSVVRVMPLASVEIQ